MREGKRASPLSQYYLNKGLRITFLLLPDVLAALSAGLTALVVSCTAVFFRLICHGCARLRLGEGRERKSQGNGLCAHRSVNPLSAVKNRGRRRPHGMRVCVPFFRLGIVFGSATICPMV